MPLIVYIPLKPNEIWDFNIDRTYVHSTWFRRSKNTYRIDPNKFTSKPVYLNTEMVSLPKWNISEEALTRIVSISKEDDEGTTLTSEYAFEENQINANNFKGDVKLGIGLFDKFVDVNIGAATEQSSSNTIRVSRKITTTRKEQSDILGSVKIYFYDPLIEDSYRLFYTSYQTHTYQAGVVKFGITVK